MNVGSMNRRSLLLLVCGVLGVLALRFGVFRDSPEEVVRASDSVPLAEKRLERLRHIAAAVPGKEILAKQVGAELAVREKGIIVADTAPQAQAQLLEIIRRVAKSEGIDARGAEELRVRPLAVDYGEVSVVVTFSCRIEQFVNFLADLANEPILLATTEIRVTSSNAKDKSVNVRLGLSGVVPRKLVPAKKGADSF